MDELDNKNHIIDENDDLLNPETNGTNLKRNQWDEVWDSYQLKQDLLQEDASLRTNVELLRRVSQDMINQIFKIKLLLAGRCSKLAH